MSNVTNLEKRKFEQLVGHQNFIPRFLGVNKNEFRHPVRSLDT